MKDKKGIRTILFFTLLVVSIVFSDATADIQQDDEVDLYVESIEELISEDNEVLADKSELQVNNALLLDSVSDIEPITSEKMPSNDIVSNDSSDDFEIVNGILMKYKGPGGDVIIPDSVTIVSNKAFFCCNKLTSVMIPYGVTRIGESAFAGCTILTEISIPSSVISIGNMAFLDCESLYSVSLPSSIQSYGFGVFVNCSSLKTISIPDGVITLENQMFIGCSCLEEVNLPSTLTTIEYHTFSDCVSLKNITIPQGVVSIASEAFSNCVQLNKIIIPSNVSKIGSKAFENCSSLMNIYIESDMIQIYTDAFDYLPSNAVFHTHCETTATKWARDKGFLIDATDHNSVTDPPVKPTCISEGCTEGAHCSVCGEVLQAQEIIPKLISIKSCKISGITDKVYTGKAVKQTISVDQGWLGLEEGTDFIVKYTHNKDIGKATVTIIGIGEYGDSVKKTFKIIPKAVKLSTVAPGVKKITVKWKKGKSITGYEIQYSLKKNLKSANTIVISKAATLKTDIKKLKPNKTYYVRVRTYKTVNGKKYCSTWSEIKSTRVK